MSTRRPLAKPLDRPIRLGVLISGGGTTLTNFVEKIAAGQLNAEVALVIDSRNGCAGIERAQQAGLPTQVIGRRGYASVGDFRRALFDELRAVQVDLVTMAGFLSLVEVPEDFQDRVMNIHPGLIPSFCGTGFYGSAVHEAVLARGAKLSGCTVHFADNVYDHGPIILQRSVAVAEGDTPQSLAARVFEAECEAYPEAVRLFAEGRLEIDDQRVRVLGSSSSSD